MGLLSGTKLGPYEIQSPLGAGGMGEVYRSRDMRLLREVALKVLPESFANHPDRLQRFEQEARAIAALNHPNILAVHDFGQDDGIHYIVTELLEGQSLREKLSAGPMSLRRALEYAQQIARGLASAHERGIVHRDLKPENLFITRDGQVKILDFGLAKQIPLPTLDGNAPTVGKLETAAGVVLGTAGYMSPEQVKGQTADHRTDIFSFGAVLYEMLTARRAFQGGSTVETMNAILKDDPEAITRSSEMWPSLQRLVEHCLEKDPAERFQSTRDLIFALEAVGDSSISWQATPKRPSRQHRWKLPAISLALLILATGAFTIGSYLSRGQQPEYVQLTYRLGYMQAARFAADGETVLYGASWDQPGMKLYSSSLDGKQERALDMPPAELLAVSRSGEMAIALNGKTWIGIGSRLARSPVTGGAPRELVDNVVAADWSPGGQLAIARYANGKCRVEYPIGKSLYETIGYISHLRFSPQADAIAFIEHPIEADDRGTIVLLDLSGRKRALTREWNGAQGLAWSPDGSEVWFTATADVDVDRPLFAVTRSGRQRLILRAPGGLYLEDIAADGRVLIRRDERRYQVLATKMNGESRVLSWLELMGARSLSQDGKFVLMVDESGKEYGVYLRNLDGSPPILLGPGAAGGISPDGRWVTSILPNDTSKILLLPTSVGEPKTIGVPGFQYRGAGWASDGRHLVVQASESKHPFRFWFQDLNGDAPKPVTPEGVGGILVTVNHSDYISTVDPTTATIRLYPINGGDSKVVGHLNPSEQVIGGTPNSENLYVMSNGSDIPVQIYHLSIKTGARRLFVTINPKDLTGVFFIIAPIFAADEKQYVYTWLRDFSVLYLVKGLR